MESNNQIQLVQQPVIKHALQAAGAEVTKRLEDLNIESLIATEDTYKALKVLRADLNKELDNFEAQRKFIKDGVLNPYNEFETIYKEEISEKYKKAIGTLKDKIAMVEDRIKADKRAALEAYFTELCAAEKIDFVRFDSIDMDINLSTSEKKYKEYINEFIAKTQDDLKLIETHEHQAEVLVEYKRTLNVSRAITEVNERKKREAEEQERIKVQETKRRLNQLVQEGFKFDSLTNCMVYDDDIFIPANILKEASAAEWNTKHAELQESIAEKKKILQAQEAAAAASNPQDGGLFSAPIIEQPMEAPVEEPLPEKQPELVTASFEVTGTMAQIKALGQFMRENNIKYTNI